MESQCNYPLGLELLQSSGVHTPKIQDIQKAISFRFNCDTIEQLEDDFLNLGRALAELELSVSAPTYSDHAIAEALASVEHNVLASTESDAIIAETIAA